jgi:hypothetical protein
VRNSAVALIAAGERVASHTLGGGVHGRARV